MSTKVEFTEEEWSAGTVQTVRKALGKTEAEIAEKAGISEETYKSYEAGKISDIKTHVKIHQALKGLGGKHPNPR
jgi:transcriptional regulator with XRE-family HTH domain